MESINNKEETQLKKPIPGNNPVKVQNTTIAPYKYTGILFMQFPNGDKYFGTGILVAKADATQTQYVLTCAHNLYSGYDGGKATKIEFIRAYDYPSQPYPGIQAMDWFYPDGYASGDITLDYGLIKLETPIELNGPIPYLSIKSDEELQYLSVQLNAYGWYGEIMSYAMGKIIQITSNFLHYPISTKKGAAGAAITKDNQIVGIHTREGDKDYNMGIRITQTVKNTIEQWMI
jgi:V8-like Glu-specific endopeptidase